MHAKQGRFVWDIVFEAADLYLEAVLRNMLAKFRNARIVKGYTFDNTDFT